MGRCTFWAHLPPRLEQYCYHPDPQEVLQRRPPRQPPPQQASPSQVLQPAVAWPQGGPLLLLALLLRPLSQQAELQQR